MPPERSYDYRHPDNPEVLRFQNNPYHEKIDYVANNDYAKFKMSSSASQLKDKIENDVQASYLLYLAGLQTCSILEK